MHVFVTADHNGFERFPSLKAVDYLDFVFVVAFFLSLSVCIFFCSFVLLIEIHCIEMRWMRRMCTLCPTCYCNRVIPSSSHVCMYLYGTCFILNDRCTFSSFLSHSFQRGLYIYRSYLLPSRISSIRIFFLSYFQSILFIGLCLYYMSMNSPRMHLVCVC